MKVERRRRNGERSVVPPADFRSYYDRPVLKEPVWRWEIPAYFFVGGVAAGSALLAAGGDATGARTMARRCRVAALTSAGVSTALLIADLGRPDRFHHMLRVAKPTSPLSMGSWILAGFSSLTGLAVVGDRVAALRPLGRAAGVGAAALAPALASYTAVLVADTAIPAWHHAYRELPFLFVGGAAASAGALAAVITPREEAGAARRLTVVGAVLEVAASQRMVRALPTPVAEVYERGPVADRSKIGRALTLVGAAAVATLGRRSRAGACAGAALVLAGAAIERFVVVDAGRASARDPGHVASVQRHAVEVIEAEEAGSNPRAESPVTSPSANGGRS